MSPSTGSTLGALSYQLAEYILAIPPFLLEASKPSNRVSHSANLLCNPHQTLPYALTDTDGRPADIDVSIVANVAPHLECIPREDLLSEPPGIVVLGEGSFDENDPIVHVTVDKSE
jgi:hypothetical protein